MGKISRTHLPKIYSAPGDVTGCVCGFTSVSSPPHLPHSGTSASSSSPKTRRHHRIFQSIYFTVADYLSESASPTCQSMFDDVSTSLILLSCSCQLHRSRRFICIKSGFTFQNISTKAHFVASSTCSWSGAETPRSDEVPGVLDIINVRTETLTSSLLTDGVFLHSTVAVPLFQPDLFTSVSVSRSVLGDGSCL